MREEADRQQRLAEALRANLVRRKAQQRARTASAGSDSAGTEPGPQDELQG